MKNHLKNQKKPATSVPSDDAGKETSTAAGFGIKSPVTLGREASDSGLLFVA